MARVKTPEAILSYPNIFEPRGMENQTPKYSACLIFPAGTDLKELKAAALAAAIERFGKEVKVGQTTIPINKALQTGVLYWPFRDEPDDVAAKGYPEGCTFFNARSQRKPAVVSIYPDANGKPSVIEDPEKVYPGVIVMATVDPYTFDREGNRGVTFGLGNLQVIRDGDRLDGAVAASEEFDADLTAAADLSDLTDEDQPLPEGDDLSDLIG